MKHFFFMMLGFLLFNWSEANAQIHSVVTLDRELKETSALIRYNDLFWTINDSGGKPVLYGFNSGGDILKRVAIRNVENHDWEALALAKRYLLIGDFGNNFGCRRDLKIILLSLDSLNQSTASAEGTILFSYEDQNDFKKRNRKTPFDCEAMLVIDDQILLFTKDWEQRSAAVYSLKVQPGKQTAVKIASLHANGLITGATWKEKTILLCGYKDYNPLIWTYKIIDNEFKLKNREIYPKMHRYQTEGIFYYDGTIYLTAEESAIDQSIIILNQTQEE